MCALIKVLSISIRVRERERERESAESWCCVCIKDGLILDSKTHSFRQRISQRLGGGLFWTISNHSTLENSHQGHITYNTL